MKFGLRESDLRYINDTLKSFPEIRKAAIFGSRAKENYQPGSDIDIAVWGEAVTFDTISHLHAKLEEESPMPYLFDIVDYAHLNHVELREHIDRVGKLIFRRESRSDPRSGLCRENDLEKD